MRALIVDDDLMSRIVLQKMLRDYMDCDVAVNGLEAVAAFETALLDKQPYDLVCMDIMMPEMDGQTALKEIRQKEKDLNIMPSHEAKIIMTTALDTPKAVIEAFYHGGCSTYLVKPIDKKKLVLALREAGLIR